MDVKSNVVLKVYFCPTSMNALVSSAEGVTKFVSCLPSIHIMFLNYMIRQFILYLKVQATIIALQFLYVLDRAQTFITLFPKFAEDKQRVVKLTSYLFEWTNFIVVKVIAFLIASSKVDLKVFL